MAEWKLAFLVIIYLLSLSFGSKGSVKTKKLGRKVRSRDVSAGATGATLVAPKFSDTLTLSQPGGADSAHHCRGRT